MASKVDEQMLLIMQLDPEAVLKFSKITSKWYVSTSIEVSNGSIIGSVCEHRNSFEAALAATLVVLQTADWRNQVLVTDGFYSDKRKHWLWINERWTDVTPDRSEFY